jgi:hypothetical protein
MIVITTLKCHVNIGMTQNKFCREKTLDHTIAMEMIEALINNFEHVLEILHNVQPIYNIMQFIMVDTQERIYNVVLQL